ncbi:N-acetylmuramoyl-L-alanine amidase [Paenibacillus agricola]|uniref:AMIN domain-containing protein n=1 Tax=Paenibacillus agricola TaxID=2716264 RepID=A0ABX0J3H8_9BACL|nr:N-acetylmuramoyl-L-alanine amidase [Paenibacillus agricola]NHN28676.1 AMIN domain-containing protein [Paenibacillus agricola]
MRVFTTIFSLLLLSLFLYPLMAQAESEPRPLLLFLDGKQLTAEVAPQINNDGNTIVPVRIIAQSLGSKVQWDEPSRKVTLDKADVNIQMFIGKKNAIVNKKAVTLETAPSIIDGNTMLPVRFISEQFGIKVTWDELTQSVFLSKEENGTKPETVPPVTNPAPAGGEKVIVADAPIDISKDEGSTKPPVKDSTKPPVETPSSLPVDGSKDKPSAPTKPADPIKEQPAAAPNSGVTAAPLKPIPTFTNNPPGYVGSKEIEVKNESLTTVQGISIVNEQLIVRLSGAKAVPNAVISKTASSIQIDIPNAKLDSALKLNTSGEGIVSGNSNSISKTRYLLFSKESSIVRIIIDLKSKVDLQPSVANSATQLAWSFVPAKERYTVVIDPGHGGKDTGALSVTSRLEKDFVLAMGTKVFNLLAKEPKIEAVLTRNKDTFVELEGRAAIANDRTADLFVSIHGNATTKEEIEGVETYYYSEKSLAFAKLMHEKIVKASGFSDRKVKQSGFYVIKNTTMPSLLLELGFLTNRAEEEAMFTDALQNKVAASIVAGIKEQLNIE